MPKNYMKNYLIEHPTVDVNARAAQDFLDLAIYDCENQLLGERIKGYYFNTSVELFPHKNIRSFFHAAAMCGNLEAVKKCVEMHGNLEVKDDWGFTPLSIAAYAGQFRVVAYLLSCGAKVDAQLDFNYTALIETSGVRYGLRKHIFTAIILLKSGANATLVCLHPLNANPIGTFIDVAKNCGPTPFLEAVIPYLDKAKNGMSPKEAADVCGIDLEKAMREKAETDNELIELGFVSIVGVNDINNSNNNSNFSSTSTSETKIIDYLANKDVNSIITDPAFVNLLIEFAQSAYDSPAFAIQAATKSFIPNKCSYFFACCIIGCTNVVKYMLEHKNPNLAFRDNWTQTPLTYAASYGRFEVVKLLIEYGDDVNAFSTRAHISAVMHAIYSWCHSMDSGQIMDSGMHFETTAVFLVACGANVTVAARAPGEVWGTDNPLDYVYKKGRKDILSKIIPHLDVNYNGISKEAAAKKYGIDLAQLNQSSSTNINNNNATNINVTSAFEQQVPFQRNEMRAYLNKYLVDVNSYASQDFLNLVAHYIPEGFETREHYQAQSREVATHGGAQNKRTYLHVCAQSGNLEATQRAVELAKEKGTLNLEIKDVYGETALGLAAYQGHYRAVDFLIKSGASVDHVRNGCTSLMYVACFNTRDAIYTAIVLLKYSASALKLANRPEISQMHSHNFLRIAENYGHQEFLETVILFLDKQRNGMSSEEAAEAFNIDWKKAMTKKKEIEKELAKMGVLGINPAYNANQNNQSSLNSLLQRLQQLQQQLFQLQQQFEKKTLTNQSIQVGQQRVYAQQSADNAALFQQMQQLQQQIDQIQRQIQALSMTSQPTVPRGAAVSSDQASFRSFMPSISLPHGRDGVATGGGSPSTQVQLAGHMGFHTQPPIKATSSARRPGNDNNNNGNNQTTESRNVNFSGKR